MRTREVPVHYLRPNERVWSPPAVICFDTETRADMSGDDEIHRLRCWSATFNDRKPPKGRPAAGGTAEGTTAAQLAFQVDLWCRKRRTVWMYAHNLHFDLSVTDLVRQLGLLGWQVSDFAVDGGSPFVRLASHDHHLTVCDSWSWLPVPLADIADAVGITKPPLPDNAGSAEDWLARCRADTAILTAAMVGLMDWWDSAELGNWAITGNAAGFNAMRHLPMSRRILIDPAPDRLNADRAAIYGGRRGTWVHGELPPGRYAELDLEKAYPTVCRDLPLPIERMARFDSLPLDHAWLRCERLGVIAQCVIRTDVPRWPVRVDGKVWYPVGEFTTTLAGPDIAEAMRCGALVSVGAGWVHKLGYALRNWATWVIGVQNADDGTVPPVAKITARGWGRSVIGKWAQRGFETIRLGPSPGPDWTFTEAWHHNANVRASILDFGGWRWQTAASSECENSYPAIFAFVESYVRVALGRAIETIGTAAMVACDTDGMIIDVNAAKGALNAELGKTRRGVPAGKRFDALVAVASNAAAPLRLREKHMYRRVTVLGPQHLHLDKGRRTSGIPGSAQPLGDGRVWARLWPKIGWQISRGRRGAFVRPVQTYRIAGSYAAGWITDRGAVLPAEVARGPDGSNHLARWPQTRHAAAGVRLGPIQSERLARYVT